MNFAKGNILPYFFLLGAPNSGTEIVANILAHHKDIYLPKVNELKYFSNDDIYRRGIGYYYQYFEDVKEQKAIGEVSPQYLLHGSKVARRMRYLYHDRHEQLRFIVVLKNPIERTLEHYKELFEQGVEQLDFEQALIRESKLAEDKRILARGLTLGLYVSCSKYGEQLNRWFDAYKREQFLILTEDDLKLNPAKSYKRICAHLGIPFQAILPIQKNIYRKSFFRRFKLTNTLLGRENSNVILNTANRHLASQKTYKVRAEIIEQLKSVFRTDLESLPLYLQQHCLSQWNLSTVKEKQTVLKADPLVYSTGSLKLGMN